MRATGAAAPRGRWAGARRDVGTAARAPRAAADERLPPDGILEELDGSPIGPPPSDPGRPPPARPAISWRRMCAAATALTARQPSLWAFALVAFLARGGLAALALPIVVAPTFVGLANFVGPTSVTAEGPGPRLVALVALGVATGAALAVVGTLVAAAAEVALHRATLAASEATAGAAAAPVRAAAFERGATPVVPPAAASPGSTVARVAALRLMLLVPVAAAVAVAIPPWVTAAYRELTLPSDVTTPLLVRVLAGAPAASVAVLAAWLAAEVVGGFAARRAVFFGAPVPRALVGAALDPFRAPLGTALTVAAAITVSVLLIAPAWWVVGVAWDAARHAFADETNALAAVGAALLLALAWLAVLALAAITAAWRATLVTADLLRRPR